MDVTLTIEDAEGVRDTVSAKGKDYPTAYEAARALIPLGSRALSIRTDSA